MKTIPVLIVLLALTGCSSPPPPKAEATPPAAPSQQKADKRVVVDPDLTGALRIDHVQSETGPERLIKFQVDVENLSPSVKTIYYRIEWFDGQGARLEIPAVEVPWTLLRNEHASLTVAAPTPRARDFLLTFSARGN